jgi:hypothetical protein
MTPTTKLALIGAAHVEIAQLKHTAAALDKIAEAFRADSWGDPAKDVRCHRCKHVGNPRELTTHEPHGEITVEEVCERCGDFQIDPVERP